MKVMINSTGIDIQIMQIEMQSFIKPIKAYT